MTVVRVVVPTLVALLLVGTPVELSSVASERAASPSEEAAALPAEPAVVELPSIAETDDSELQNSLLGPFLTR